MIGIVRQVTPEIQLFDQVVAECLAGFNPDRQQFAAPADQQVNFIRMRVAPEKHIRFSATVVIILDKLTDHPSLKHRSFHIAFSQFIR